MSIEHPHNNRIYVLYYHDLAGGCQVVHCCRGRPCAVPGVKWNGTPYPLRYQGRAAFPTEDPVVCMVEYIVGSGLAPFRMRNGTGRAAFPTEDPVVCMVEYIVGSGLAPFRMRNGTGHPIRFATRAGPHSLRKLLLGWGDLVRKSAPSFFFFYPTSQKHKQPVDQPAR